MSICFHFSVFGCPAEIEPYKESNYSVGTTEELGEVNNHFLHSKSLLLFLIVAPNFCQDISVVRFLCIDPMVSGSNHPSAKLSLRVRRFAIPLLF